MQTKDVSGTIIDFRIGRPYGANPAEAHKISFYIVGGGKSAFLDETSDTNTLCVDKIRATYGGELMCFDVHYNASSANEVLVYFDVYGKGQANGTSIAMGLASVADAPAGETVLTTHEFMAHTDGIGSISVGSDASSVYGASYSYLIKRHSVVYVRAYCVTKSISSGAWRTLATVPAGFRPPLSHDFAAINNSNDTPIHARITSGGELNVWPNSNLASGTQIIFDTSYITNA